MSFFERVAFIRIFFPDFLIFHDVFESTPYKKILELKNVFKIINKIFKKDCYAFQMFYIIKSINV